MKQLACLDRIVTLYNCKNEIIDKIPYPYDDENLLKVHEKLDDVFIEVIIEEAKCLVSLR